jgi:DNA-damage-inducible protein J
MAIVQARLAPEIKEEATRILAAMGMTPSEAVRLLFRRVVAEKRFPLELLAPNEATITAMQEQNLPSFDTIDDLMADLNAHR